MNIRLPDPIAPEQAETLSPLEEGLRGPEARLLQEQIRAQLGELEQRTRQAMSAGVAPQRFRELAALLDACVAAHEVLGNALPARPEFPIGASVRLN